MIKPTSITTSYAALLFDNGTAQVWSVTDQAWAAVSTPAQYGAVFRTVEQERDAVTRHLLGAASRYIDRIVADLKDHEGRPANIGLYEYLKHRRFALPAPPPEFKGQREATL